MSGPQVPYPACRISLQKPHKTDPKEGQWQMRWELFREIWKLCLLTATPYFQTIKDTFCISVLSRDGAYRKQLNLKAHLPIWACYKFRALPFWRKHWLSIKSHFSFFLFSKWSEKSVLYYSNSVLQQENAGKCATEWSQNMNVVVFSLSSVLTKKKDPENERFLSIPTSIFHTVLQISNSP